MIAQLDTKTVYSFMESMISIRKYVDQGKAYGYSALGIMDVDNLYGSYYFIKECQKQGIQPLLGLEVTAHHKEELVNLRFLALSNHGYRNLCEGWVCDTYRKAGLHYSASCCASHARERFAIKTGKIPIGAVIYSSKGYKSGVRCSCGRDAGHVAIYIGDGKVAGSQTPYIMDINDWIALCGYGGYSFNDNNIKVKN